MVSCRFSWSVGVWPPESRNSIQSPPSEKVANGSTRLPLEYVNVLVDQRQVVQFKHVFSSQNQPDRAGSMVSEVERRLRTTPDRWRAPSPQPRVRTRPPLIAEAAGSRGR